MNDDATFDLDQVQESILRCWAKSRAGLPVPLLDALDPLTFEPFVLPHLIVAEYLNDHGRVLYRLVGEEMVQRWGENFKGKRSDQLFTGAYRAFMEQSFAMSRSERCPIYSESVFRCNDGGWIKTTRLMLPFAAEPDGVPVRVLIAQVFLPAVTPRPVPEIRLIRAPDMSGGVIVPLSDV